MSDVSENPESKIEQGSEGAKIESRDKSPESLEERYEDKITGAEILEEPKDGSFVRAMQLFVAWVNNLLGKKPD